MAMLQRIARAALDAIQHRAEQNIFKQHVNKMNDLMKEVKSTDLPLDLEFSQLIATTDKDEPPVSYVGICEHDKFTFSLFVLKNGAKIPLHDHPGMHGVLKVLHGKLFFHTYTASESLSSVSGEISAVDHGVVEIGVGVKDDTCSLTPETKNFHEIEAKDGPAAFLDILFPSYNPNIRPCKYYQVVRAPKDGSSGNKRVLLRTIPAPAEFWTQQTAKYIGPPIEVQ